MFGILGIDIGTSSSAVAYTSGGRPMVLTHSIESRHNGKGFLSCLMFGPNGELLKTAGKTREEQDKRPGFFLRYFKRIMGYNFVEMRDGIKKGERFLHEYKDIIEMKGRGRLLIPLGEKSYTPEIIMAIFLKKLSAYAEKMIGEEINDAILTIPSLFHPAQRKSMKKAGEMVFNSVELIEEPLAAILGCKLEAEAKKSPVVVFDVGMGNLEIKVVKIGSDKDGKPELITLNRAGNREIGGIDMDYAILEYLMERNRILRNTFPSASFNERRNFLWMIEDAKTALSLRLETKMEGNIGDELIDEGLARHELEDIIKPIIKDYENALLEAIEEGELHPEEVGHLILVGGPTRMPAVIKMLKRVFNDNKRIVEMLEKKDRAIGDDSRPMEILAKGAAVYPLVYPAACPAITSRIEAAAKKAEKEKGIGKITQFVYGIFYDEDVGFEPLIQKKAAEKEPTRKKGTNTALFSRPDGRVSLIQSQERENVAPSYSYLIFSFFLPPQEYYKIKFILELKEGELTLSGSHQAIGTVVYSHIPLEINRLGEKAADEAALNRHLHDLIIKEAEDQKDLGVIDSDAAVRCTEVVHKKVALYYQIPEMREITNKLGETLHWFKKDYSVTRYGKEIETKTARLLNRDAEVWFTLLRYNLISFNEYMDMIRSLHQVYRLEHVAQASRL